MQNPEPGSSPGLRLFFEDFSPGWSATYGPLAVTREEIVAFARAYDPQPFHLDEAAARHTFVGELIASGWHSCALLMRLTAEGLLPHSSSMGAPGVDEVKWQRPVRPGDSLRARITVLECRESRSRPELGFVHMRSELLNQHGDAALVQTFWAMFGRRGTDFSAARKLSLDGPARALAPPQPSPDPAELEAGARFFDDVEVGALRRFGSYTFEADEIVRFAKAFDPQPFHLDREAARRSHFGELCASGWHTGAACMRRMVEHRNLVREAAAGRGVTPAAQGSSPGIRDLKWLKPVYAGDTVTYASTIVDKRPTGSRPGWGLVFSHNVGDNQYGERVFEFSGAVFWQRRPA